MEKEIIKKILRLARTFIVGLFIFMVCWYLISSVVSGGFFDTQGGFIKDMAESRDIKGYQESSEVLNYKELYLDTDNMVGKNVKFWGKIVDTRVSSNRAARYTVEVNLNSQTKQELNRYLGVSEVDNWYVVANVGEEYNNFNIGDEVEMFGELTRLRLHKGFTTPFMDVVSVEIVVSE